ncbi:hypothetical protein ZIOFF_001688 [Zingiber officinale]|uniref:DDE Tnp4 domain-containing protein n=1 Tax=Zingiber officinale TaxID=94328 RepID=A0A8J5IKF3_ZINOF|nr:hypothetical protein ZIOFF_001688 [Zingiber officinale]
MRKGCISTNVLGVCCPNMQFIYVLLGWEGSTHYGRVLRDAILRPHGLRAPRGKQYRLKEFHGHRLETLEEYFNMKHSKARNIIERCFGFFDPQESLIADEEEESDGGSDDEEVEMTTITPSIARGRGKNKQYWTDEEVEALVDALIELASDPLWKDFKFPYLCKLDIVWGKDRVTGLGAEDVVDAIMDANWQKHLSVSSSSDNEDEHVLDIL